MGVYVGIDVTKQHLDWVVGAEGVVARAPNRPAGVRRLVAKLVKLEIASRRGGSRRDSTHGPYSEVDPKRTLNPLLAPPHLGQDAGVRTRIGSCRLECEPLARRPTLATRADLESPEHLERTHTREIALALVLLPERLQRDARSRRRPGEGDPGGIRHTVPTPKSIRNAR